MFGVMKRVGVLTLFNRQNQNQSYLRSFKNRFPANIINGGSAWVGCFVEACADEV